MSPSEKQAEIDFMAGQALAMEFNALCQGKKIVVIANAISLTLGTFCMTTEADPSRALAVIVQAARQHMQTFDPTPPGKSQVN